VRCKEPNHFGCNESRFRESCEDVGDAVFKRIRRVNKPDSMYISYDAITCRLRNGQIRSRCNGRRSSKGIGKLRRPRAIARADGGSQMDAGIGALE